MITIARTRYDSFDTYSRRLILSWGRFSIDFSRIALKDEGCDLKAIRVVLHVAETVVGEGGDCTADHYLAEIGITRDHVVADDSMPIDRGTIYSTPWRPTARAYSWNN
jgi:hypothetical protein